MEEEPLCQAQRLCPGDPDFHLPRDGLGLEMHSWRCLCTENPGDRKERVTEGRGPKLRRAVSRSDRPAAGPSHPGTHPGAAGVALTEERP